MTEFLWNPSCARMVERKGRVMASSKSAPAVASRRHPGTVDRQCGGALRLHHLQLLGPDHRQTVLSGPIGVRSAAAGAADLRPASQGGRPPCWMGFCRIAWTGAVPSSSGPPWRVRCRPIPPSGCCPMSPAFRRRWRRSGTSRPVLWPPSAAPRECAKRNGRGNPVSI